jgi:hypothetical protein
MDLADEPVRSYLGDYGSVPLEAGMRGTYQAFRALLADQRLSAERLS